jgi:CheY-like chemotaxis protein
MGRVLVADDDAIIRRLVQRVLEGMGHEVTVAENGMDTLKLAMGEEFDLYILDVRMPRLDGYSLCRSITQKYPARKVILITGLDIAKYEPMSKASGATLTIGKPFDIARLQKAVAPFLPQ